MRVLVAMAALVAAAARAGSPSCASTRPPAESLVAHTSPWNGLPPGFRAALAERDTQLVAVVAAGIDPGRGLDVVARRSTPPLPVLGDGGARPLPRQRP